MSTPPESPTSPTEQSLAFEERTTSPAPSPRPSTPRLKLPLKKLSLPLIKRARPRSTSLPTNAMTRDQQDQVGETSGEHKGDGSGGMKLGGGSAKNQSSAPLTPAGSRRPSVQLPERAVSPNTAIAREAREIFATPVYIEKPLCPGHKAAQTQGEEGAESEGKKPPCSGQVEQECSVM